MTSLASGHLSVRLVALLLIIEAISVFTLLTLNSANALANDIFTILMAISIVSLAMISSIYRAYKQGNGPDKIFLSMGCGMILMLVYVCFAL
jgi:hypothetical protein